VDLAKDNGYKEYDAADYFGTVNNNTYTGRVAIMHENMGYFEFGGGPGTGNGGGLMYINGAGIPAQMAYYNDGTVKKSQKRLVVSGTNSGITYAKFVKELQDSCHNLYKMTGKYNKTLSNPALKDMFVCAPPGSKVFYPSDLSTEQFVPTTGTRAALVQKQTDGVNASLHHNLGLPAANFDPNAEKNDAQCNGVDVGNTWKCATLHTGHKLIGSEATDGPASGNTDDQYYTCSGGVPAFNTYAALMQYINTNGKDLAPHCGANTYDTQAVPSVDFDHKPEHWQGAGPDSNLDLVTRYMTGWKYQFDTLGGAVNPGDSDASTGHNDQYKNAATLITLCPGDNPHGRASPENKGWNQAIYLNNTDAKAGRQVNRDTKTFKEYLKNDLGCTSAYPA